MLVKYSKSRVSVIDFIYYEQFCQYFHECVLEKNEKIEFLGQVKKKTF